MAGVTNSRHCERTRGYRGNELIGKSLRVAASRVKVIVAAVSLLGLHSGNAFPDYSPSAVASAHCQRRYNVLALEGHMARKRVKESGPSLLLVALIAAQAAAYEHPLNSSAIWNAYFLGSSNSESVNFLSKYKETLPPPKTGPYIAEW